jgi:SAM-dependent methyltransferase
MIELDPSDLDAARRHLTPDSALPLIRFMAHQSLGAQAVEAPAEIGRQATDLGWVDARTGARTTLGTLISDSCREYLFWKERDGALPFEDALPHLARATFEGKYVAEIGAGMGANLMSLSGTAGRLCGVEPVAAYVQLGRIFREREGIEDVEIRLGGAEDLPFEDGELDLVLCVTAHQYFDLNAALQEIARVIRPGGELIILGGTLGQYAADVGLRVVRSGGRRSREYVITLVNTLGYQALGRRLLPSRGAFSTSRPIYPSVGFMTRHLQAAGFETLAPPQRAAGERCFYLRRRKTGT